MCSNVLNSKPTLTRIKFEYEFVFLIYETRDMLVLVERSTMFYTRYKHIRHKSQVNDLLSKYNSDYEERNRKKMDARY